MINFSPFPQEEGFLRISCATDKAPMGPLPLVDGLKVLTLDWFKKPDCTQKVRDLPLSRLDFRAAQPILSSFWHISATCSLDPHPVERYLIGGLVVVPPQMCLHTVDLDDTMCEAPSCLLDPEPGQAIRDQDLECQCAGPPDCRAPDPMSCGMCTPKYNPGQDIRHNHSICYYFWSICSCIYHDITVFGSIS